MQDEIMNVYRGIYTTKGSSKKEACYKRELITKEVSLIKKMFDVKCSFEKQAMTYLAWSMPSTVDIQ